MTTDDLIEKARDLSRKGRKMFPPPGEMASVIRSLADALESAEKIITAARAEVEQYERWYIDCPEDSWRFERDIRVALGMPQAADEEETDR